MLSLHVVAESEGISLFLARKRRPIETKEPKRGLFIDIF